MVTGQNEGAGPGGTELDTCDGRVTMLGGQIGSRTSTRTKWTRRLNSRPLDGTENRYYEYGFPLGVGGRRTVVEVQYLPLLFHEP